MKYVFTILALCLSVQAFAAENVCDDPSELGKKLCSTEKLNKADIQLNIVYRDVLAAAKKADATTYSDVIGKEPNEVESRLISAERAWITFRDSSCTLESVKLLGGAGEGVIFVDCLLRKTLERTKELTEIKKMM